MNGLEVGVQLHLPTNGSTTARDIKELAHACAGNGVEQLWFTDNLGSRSLFVILASLASMPIRLGAAVMVQYFRSPLEAASALATVSELIETDELSVGLGRGNPRTFEKIEMPRAIAFMRETAQALRLLWQGEALETRRFPLVAEYFHYVDGAPLRLAFRPGRALRLYGGGSGPLGVKAAHELMDGMIVNGTMFLPALTLGRLPAMLATPGGGPAAGFRRVADLKISVDRDGSKARDFARLSVAQRMISLRKSGFGAGDFAALGIDPAGVDRLSDELGSGRLPSEVQPLVSDAMVDAVFIAGDPGACRERLTEVAQISAGLDIDQLMFSEVGPSPASAIPLLLEEVVARI